MAPRDWDWENPLYRTKVSRRRRLFTNESDENCKLFASAYHHASDLFQVEIIINVGYMLMLIKVFNLFTYVKLRATTTDSNKKKHAVRLCLKINEFHFR